MAELKLNTIVEDVLRLLLYVVAADKKIYQNEIDGFLKATTDLCLADTDGNALPRSWLFDWFLQNYQAVKTDTENSDFSTNLVHHFIRLRTWPDKKRLLSILCNIAVADGDYHLNEKVLVALAAAYWEEKAPEL
ncbi:MAG: hypothetical protein EX271_02325 [Acidimicrobiales bacterium]|nr:hypothetical protein [Hyphomonadaceae bacterium]RZV44196.1 MAG: hypothetical protein EX271_02325 [Acidimicrobiales bacterium]